MTSDDTYTGEGDSVRDKCTPDQDRSLSEAVLEGIEEYKGHSISHAEFTLYDNIDPDALENLFQHDATSKRTVAFNVDDARVTLWGDGAVEIRVQQGPRFLSEKNRPTSAARPWSNPHGHQTPS